MWQNTTGSCCERARAPQSAGTAGPVKKKSDIGTGGEGVTAVLARGRESGGGREPGPRRQRVLTTGFRLNEWSTSDLPYTPMQSTLNGDSMVGQWVFSASIHAACRFRSYSSGGKSDMYEILPLHPAFVCNNPRSYPSIIRGKLRITMKYGAGASQFHLEKMQL